LFVLAPQLLLKEQPKQKKSLLIHRVQQLQLKILVKTQKTVVDPKGMLNEKSAIVHTKREKKANGDFTNTNTIKKGDGTEVKESIDKSTEGHWTDKGKTTTTTHSKSVDPIGLGNKKTEEVEKKVITNSKGIEEINVTKKIDGETVLEEKKVN